MAARWFAVIFRDVLRCVERGMPNAYMISKHLDANTGDVFAALIVGRHSGLIRHRDGRWWVVQ